MLSTLCRAHGLVGLPGHQHPSHCACLIPSYRTGRLASEMAVGASLAGRTFRIPSVTQACAARVSTKVGGNARIDAERRSFGLRHECVGSRSQASQGWEVTQCQRTRPCYFCIVGIFPNPYKPLRYCPVYFPYQSDSLIP